MIFQLKFIIFETFYSKVKYLKIVFTFGSKRRSAGWKCGIKKGVDELVSANAWGFNLLLEAGLIQYFLFCRYTWSNGDCLDATKESATFILFIIEKYVTKTLEVEPNATVPYGKGYIDKALVREEFAKYSIEALTRDRLSSLRRFISPRRSPKPTICV